MTNPFRPPSRSTLDRLFVPTIQGAEIDGAQRAIPLTRWDPQFADTLAQCFEHHDAWPPMYVMAEANTRRVKEATISIGERNAITFEPRPPLRYAQVDRQCHRRGHLSDLEHEEMIDSFSWLQELTRSFTPESVCHLVYAHGPAVLDTTYRLGGWPGLVTLIAGGIVSDVIDRELGVLA